MLLFLPPQVILEDSDILPASCTDPKHLLPTKVSLTNGLEMGSQGSSLEEALPEGQGTVGLCDPCAKADPARVGLGPKRSRSRLEVWCPWSLSKVREEAGGRARNGLWLPALCAQPSSSAFSTRLLHVIPRVLLRFSRSLLFILWVFLPPNGAQIVGVYLCHIFSIYSILFIAPRT